MDTTSYWRLQASLPRFPEVREDLEVDVIVLGAGITGITAAYLLRKSGFTVALVERGRCGGFDSSNTTAHLTCVTDTQLHVLARQLGKERARATWRAGQAAIEQIYANLCDERIECEFMWIPAYHYPATLEKADLDGLRHDVDVAKELGIAAEYVQSVPVIDRPGVRYLRQAKFQPLKYLSALLCHVPGYGCHVFENSEAHVSSDDLLNVRVGDHTIRGSYLIVATHNPLVGKAGIIPATLLQTKLFLYTTYVVGARIPEGSAEEASYWDTADPYSYLRIDRKHGFDYAILGGEDRKTGQEKNSLGVFERLDRAMIGFFPQASIETHWSGQVIESTDSLPYIGEIAERQFIATGYAGNGMTFGTLAAMMAVDAISKRPNPWRELFDPHRSEIRMNVGEYVRENLDFPYHLVRERLEKADGESIDDLDPNQGKILKLDGRKTAVFRNEAGELFFRSPVCTHLKCIVKWNDAEKTWDCPCHGSRFAPTGEVLSGPAESPLAEVHESENVVSRR